MELLAYERVAILVVDVQERLAQVMPQTDMAKLLRAARILLETARQLELPVLVTRQYPKGLGAMVPDLEVALSGTRHSVVDKTCFSAMGSSEFAEQLRRSQARTVLLLGLEAHICVFQTARDLVRAGVSTHVMADGVASRDPELRELGLALCQRAGAVASCSETAAFDLLGDSSHPAFKPVSALLR